MMAASITAYKWPSSRRYRAGPGPAVSAPLVHHRPGTALAASTAAQGCSGSRRSGSIQPAALPAAASSPTGTGVTQWPRHRVGRGCIPFKGSFTGIAANFEQLGKAPAPPFSRKPRCFLLPPSSCFVSVPISSCKHHSSASYLFISSNGISLQVAEQLK